ncbi:hypothetical protein VCHENC02_1194A, partial [Vibrio harveyi]
MSVCLPCVNKLADSS